MTQDPPLNARQRRIHARKQAIKWLKQRWPRVFAGQPVPLSLGANERILQARLEDSQAPPARSVKDALRWWVNQPPYLRRVAAGQPRRDLEGQEVEPVTSEHQAYARIRYREIKRRQDPEVATSGSS